MSETITPALSDRICKHRNKDHGDAVLFYLGLSAVLLSSHLPVAAQNCRPLSLLGGEGSEVTKTVSQPTVPGPFGVTITRNNWNTDWAVPGGRSFQRFIVTVSVPRAASFDIRLFLKYSDQTNEEFFNTNGVRIEPDKPLTITATVRANDQPFLVNLFVNGIQHIGNTYTASVVGCER
ncbi:MAG: hypothetical protein EHM73_05555 [Chroococcales cyanobacterium metabat2.561]|jgi:hypothetical protein|uniref:Uncharacterized protein n=1 Tax=Microcystis aeruginosa Ma_SC_T_19800800_S464 TaxID=2486257 RepID=A0A552DS10_MICAE|nr:MAG: hypothetical protein EHM73_05555 [Chroococcales cyanobacterium metabat2.561]TRU24987.1 MAG: hypothetical protein EWV81_13030 [Microcystis aeruginosa Ma_SC_T_19800800_S464]